MAQKRRSSASAGSLRIIGVMVVLLAVLVAAAFFFAPHKESAPPSSHASIETRPESAAADDNLPDVVEMSEGPLRALRPRRFEEPAPAAQETPAAEYVIRGLVRDARTSTVLAGVRVRARRAWTPAEESDWRARQVVATQARDFEQMRAIRREEEQLRLVESAETGEEGTYEVRVSQPGQYSVEYVLSGYVPATREAGPLDETALEAVVDVEISSGAAISGRVTETGSSRGAAGVNVRVEGSPLPPAVTDQDGAYELAGLGVGEYSVTLELRDTPYRTGEVLPFQKVRITAPDEVLKNVNFTVEPAGVIWGYVQTADRAPVSGADVITCTSASVVSQALTAMVKREPPVRGNSEEDGYYELLGVPLNEEWRVYATSGSYSPQLSDPVALTANAREVRVDLFLFEGSTIYGRVIDPDGKPIPRANVLCLPGYSSLFTPMDTPKAFRDANSDENGEYVIKELPPGDYQIMGRMDGYKFSAFGDSVFSDGYSQIKGIDIVLYPVESGDRRVFGIVVDASDKPVSSARVVLSGLGTESLSRASRETSTAIDGRFDFGTVEDGLYVLNVNKEGYGTQTIRNVPLDREVRVKLSATAFVRGRVLIKETNQPPRSYNVAAVPMSAEAANTGEDLMRMFETPESYTFNDPAGYYELQLEPGDYRIEGSAEGYTPARKVISLEAGAIVDDVDLYLTQNGGRIEGKVTTADGKSPQGALVTLIDADSPSDVAASMGGGQSNSSHAMRVGEDGAFLFEQLAAGNYIAVAQHERYTTARSETLVLEEMGQVNGVELRLTFGGSIEGYVSSNGRRVAGAVVTAVGQGEPRATETDENGFYRIDGLAPGHYMVTATPFQSGDINAVLQMRPRTADVEEGQTVTVNFGDETGATIEGVCTPPPPSILGAIPGGLALLRYPGASSVPLGGSVNFANLAQATMPVAGGSIDGSGFFTIEGIPAGSYQIDIFYAFGLELRYVATTMIEVAGEESVQVELGVSVF